MPFTRILFALVLAVLLASTGVQAQTCTPIQISWPDDVDPIWELTALPPSLSTGPSGSGLEIRDVKYRGISVLKRGHVPMINVRYITGICYRDWASSNTRFEASNQTAACFAEPETGTVQTVCDRGVGVPDAGDFRGIAMEDFGDGFTLTSHSEAGWYRYKIMWTFELDGTIRPEFGFSHTPSGAAENARWHHAYWRLDFDIETADGNYVAESRDGGEWQVIENETTQLWDALDDAIAPTRWAVFNHESGLGYELTPGELEYLAPANPGTGDPGIDNFAKEDIAFSVYRPGQLNDGGGGGLCSVDFYRPNNTIVQGEDITDGDVVVWYRTGDTREGGNGDNTNDVCVPRGPVIRPIGEWGGPVVGTGEVAEREAVNLEAFPNPFDQSTTIRFTLDEPQEVRLTLFDALGRQVRILHEGSAAARAHEITLNAHDLPNGIYTVRLEGSAGAEASRRIVLVR